MPCVAFVHGAAIGSGCEIAGACDFIVATPEATFATPEALWGTVGATQRLPRILGKRLAKDLMFTGRKLTADETQKTPGLVTRIVRFSASSMRQRRDRCRPSARPLPPGCASPSAASTAASSSIRKARCGRELGHRGKARPPANGCGKGADVSWRRRTLGEVLERQARERGGAEALVTTAGLVTAISTFSKRRAARRDAGARRSAGRRSRRHPDGQRRDLGGACSTARR